MATNWYSSLTAAAKPQYKRLADIYDDVPHRDETLWSHIGLGEFRNGLYRVVTINPMSWARTATVNGEPIVEVYRHHAEPWQKRLVKDYQKNAGSLAMSTYLVVEVADKVVVDGFHRLVGYAKANVSEALALDLGDKYKSPDDQARDRAQEAGQAEREQLADRTRPTWGMQEGPYTAFFSGGHWARPDLQHGWVYWNPETESWHVWNEKTRKPDGPAIPRTQE
jgi:hypothetical protein